jgi:hypothetical protein
VQLLFTGTMWVRSLQNGRSSLGKETSNSVQCEPPQPSEAKGFLYVGYTFTASVEQFERTIQAAHGKHTSDQTQLVQCRPSWSVVTDCMLCDVGCPQDQSQKPPYTTAEYNAFQAADGEQDSQAKIALLDNFSVKYPDSALRPKIYRDYYLVYFSIRNYGRTIEYADKFLALGDTTDVGFRLEALMTRAQAFLASCGDAALQTPESYARTRAAAVQGLQTVGESAIPRDGIRGDGAASVLPEREHLEALFYTVAGIAESGLKGREDDTCSTKKLRLRAFDCSVGG